MLGDQKTCLRQTPPKKRLIIHIRQFLNLFTGTDFITKQTNKKLTKRNKNKINCYNFIKIFKQTSKLLWFILASINFKLLIIIQCQCAVSHAPLFKSHANLIVSRMGIWCLFLTHCKHMTVLGFFYLRIKWLCNLFSSKIYMPKTDIHLGM